MVNKMSQKTLLITGGSGYLGRQLTAKAVDSFRVYTTYTRHPGQIKAGQPLPLDLTRRDDVLRLVSTLSPQAIIHTAAINPGQGDDEMMRQVNALGSRYVAEAATAVGARLVYISSDMVHDGKNAPYADDALPSPLSGYGRSKAEAEAAVAEIEPAAAIVRTSLIYGLEEMDRGTKGFVARLRTGQPLVLFSDSIRQPVWVETLAEALLRLAGPNADFAGLLNVAGRQALSREEFGRRMLQWWQIDPGELLQSGRAADISDTIPLDLRLTVTQAEQLLQQELFGVDEILQAQRDLRPSLKPNGQN
ncbi:MAG: SDR family NAD(P)-dependent oxidoreductase [Anaerolineae bacterium]|nr:SDR family NAD(P)-dependent oxidoreductase [Anaerolineae bacterium]